MSLESDLASAFADPFATKEIVFGAQRTRGFYAQDHRQMQTQEGQVVVALATTFQYQTSTLTDVARDSEVTITGVGDFTVDHREQLEDGLVSELWLVAVSE
jgi:hypothetical protein